MKFALYIRSAIVRLFQGSHLDRRQQPSFSVNRLRLRDAADAAHNEPEMRVSIPVDLAGHSSSKPSWLETLRVGFMESVLHDVRFSLRLLCKSPGFTIIAVLTLAVAIGANAVVFSIMNGLVLRPLNVPQAQSLYGIERASDKDPSQSYPDYLDLRDRNHTFDDLAAYDVTQAGMDTGSSPFRAWIFSVSGNYFDVLGIEPYLGRFFHASEERGPNSAPYIVLSYAFWHSHFQDDRAVVGRVVQLNKNPFTIIGVAPRGFRGTLVFFSPDFFVPMINREQVEGENDLNSRGSRWIFMVMGHLKAGVTPPQAVADLNSIGSYLEKNFPKDERQMRFSLVRPGLLGDNLGGPVRAFLAGLMFLAGLILLAACANLGSLFGARAADRSREIALRLALGSPRKRILRQLLTEAMLISLGGGVVGVWGSALLLRWLSVWQPFPRNFPVHTPINADSTVYLTTLLLTVSSGFLFGAVPIRQILRTDPYQVLKSGSTGTTGTGITTRDVLLLGQIAICALLITASMVAVRGLARSLHSNFGFDPQNAMVVDTDLRMAGYTGDRIPPMQKRMVDAVANVPGVDSVGLADMLLLDGAGDSMVFRDDTADLNAANAAAHVALYHTSPEYLHTEGTALLSGRNFTWHDDKNSPFVAVVNRQFALKIFGSLTAALGSFYKMPDGTRIQVVGIAEDGKYNTLTEDPQPAMFLPILQWPSSQTWLVVRSKRDPLVLSPIVRSTLRQLDTGMPVYIDTRYKEVDAALFAPRMASVSLGVLGTMGALLALTGVFGISAYSVSKRLRDLGVRVALGAQRMEVLRAALGRPFALLVVGSTVGLLLGILATRILSLIVYQATPRDPLVLGGVLLAMTLVGLLAMWIPAQRAMSIDPVTLLREQ